MINVDASSGSGGGQVLRGALALSVLTGHAVRLTRIRARRHSPGLKLQHLKIIECLARLSQGRVVGAVIGSQSLIFEPRQALCGDPVIDIDTPGSLTLLLQTILLPLSFSGRVSQLRLVGVTHASRSPSYENLAWHWLPLLERAGYRAQVRLHVAGFAPKGGGVVYATIHPAASIEPLSLARRGKLLGVSGQSAVAGLNSSVAERQRHHVLSRLDGLNVPVQIVSELVPAAVPGAFIVLLAEFEHSQQSFFAMGELGKPPEVVASEVSDALITSLNGGGAIDSHLASQLLLPLSFANGDSELSVSRISEHMLVTAELINQYLADTVQIKGQIGQPGEVVVCGRGVPVQAAREPFTEVSAAISIRQALSVQPSAGLYSPAARSRGPVHIHGDSEFHW